MSNFIQDCVKGRAKPEDIDDYVDKWHTHNSPLLVTTLHEFLGMTKKEYIAWVNDDSKLKEIINSHKNGK